MKIYNNHAALVALFDKVKYFVNNSPICFDFNISNCKVLKGVDNKAVVGILAEEALEPGNKKDYCVIDGKISTPAEGIIWLSNYLDRETYPSLPIRYEIITNINDETILYLSDDMSNRDNEW